MEMLSLYAQRTAKIQTERDGPQQGSGGAGAEPHLICCDVLNL